MTSFGRKFGNFLSDFKLSFYSFISKLFCHDAETQPVLLFESNSDFSDNPRALFDYMIDQRLNEKYKFVWVIKDMEIVKPFLNKYENVLFIPTGKAGFNKDYLRMIHYFTVAKCTFYSHKFIGIPGKKNQRRVFLNHGAVPVKDVRGRFWDIRRNTDILSTSEFAAYYMSQILCGDVSRFRLLGLPRNDQMFVKDPTIRKQLELDQFQKIIIWLPTFKHKVSATHKRNDSASNAKQDLALLSAEMLSCINEKLKKYNIGLVIKFHPAQNLDFVRSVNMSNIVTIANDRLISLDLSLYTLIGDCDAMITDFSSVYFDYLLLNRPIAFDVTDMENYGAGVGFMLKPPTHYMPGNKIGGTEDFLQFLEDVHMGNDTYRQERENLQRIVHNHLDGKASKRIVEFLGL